MARPQVVVWGLGSGGHLYAPLEQGKRVLVLAIDLEPGSEPLVERILEKDPILGDAHRRQKLEVLVGSVSRLAARFRDCESAGETPEVMVHMPVMDHVPRAARPLAKTLERSATERSRPQRAQRTMRRNLRRNVGAIAAAPNLRALGLSARGPAFVLAAGPSAAPAVEALVEHGAPGLVIAVDTVVPLCVRAGLRIDVVCSVDPNRESARHVESLPRSGSPVLCFQPYCCPEVVQAFERRVVAVPRGDLLFDRLASSLDLTAVETHGTVLTFAIQVALMLRCDPVILAGADFAHVGGHSHAPGTAHARRIEAVGSTTLDSRGRSVPTTRVLRGYQEATERLIADSPARFFAIDGGGAAIQGASMIGLEKARHWQHTQTPTVEFPAAPSEMTVVQRTAALEESIARIEAA